MGLVHPSLGQKISQERKAKIILEHKTHELRTMVETGTRDGWMLEKIGGNFDKVYSIELDANLFHQNLEKFKVNPKIKLLMGDSAREINQVLREIKEPALFWLDAHDSGEITSENSPIIAELSGIFSHPIKNHVILVDDARHFDRKTIGKMKELARASSYKFELEDGIFRLHGR